jgi:uncharacterized OB-fold protein
MMFRCWRCGTWGLKIRHVCDNCFKDTKIRIRELAHKYK